MKCIAKGNKTLYDIFEGKCKICNSLFEAERRELNIDSDIMWDYDIANIYFREFSYKDCPECNGLKSIYFIIKKIGD